MKGDLQEKEKELKEKEKNKVKASSHLKTLQDNIKQEERKRKQIEKELQVENLKLIFSFGFISFYHQCKFFSLLN